MPRRESAFALAFVLLVVIPEGNLLLLLPSFFWLSFPKGICFCFLLHPQPQPPATIGSGNNRPWRVKRASAACNAPKGICLCSCLRSFGCHSRRESAVPISLSKRPPATSGSGNNRPWRAKRASAACNAIISLCATVIASRSARLRLASAMNYQSVNISPYFR